ncbi:alpha-1,6-mannosylglycoprotein 6-beta-N-acetylglucosaminyltransferase A-like [Littorina saxatilis]|uniref:alpha-1,6-mannosyl-glycoprotein 6-beta-N-acetylglucosaminyltransferase n=1 Tax=Littorina saxatilis TaxID=31220 RepID=A0AAN9GLZ6_9CAEN
MMRSSGVSRCSSFGGRTLWRRMVAILLLVIFIWTITVLNVTFIYTSNHPKKESAVLQEEIVQLSQEYVRALAQENDGVVDGPYAGRFTAFDLKKTIAVLLESILARLDRLETHLNNITNGSFARNMPLSLVTDHERQVILSAQDLIVGKTEKCELTDQDKADFPHCLQKMQWMKQMWKSDPCYESHGVDGSDCSYVMYLSEVEGWCPRKTWTKSTGHMILEPMIYANITTNLQGVIDLLKDPNERQGYAWIRLRVTRLWPKWVKAIHNLAANQDLSKRRKQKILIHLGLLSKQSGWKFAENQFKGGPLGELVQWSDLISVLYILGHQLTITSEVEQLVQILSAVPEAKSPCQTRKELPVTIIYTDIMGLIQFKKRTGSGFSKFSCLFRIVDSFGTEPAFNHRVFAKQNKILTSWGGQDLNPRQFFTMFPHSPDNSFMGFVVEHHLNDTVSDDQPRRDIAVVYGKNEYMWEGKQAYLDVIKEHLEIHGTVFTEEGKKSNLPSYVINHGILSGPELHQLLRQAKMFIGLGFPYEGPAPLEAIANGAVFLNPRFSPPHSSKNTKFFKGKPTQREVTSQHPYAEVFVGKPHVYTIDMKNLTEVQLAVEEVLKQDTFTAYTPYEYTEEGMLQRMSAYIQHQQFCDFQHKVSKWPPSSVVTFVLGQSGQSCTQACWTKDFICEPSHFLELNSEGALRNATSICSGVGRSANIYYPSVNVDKGECTLQEDEMLFSCVGGRDNYRRLCPCRNYIPQQSALCLGCER